jgi:ribonuclease R
MNINLPKGQTVTTSMLNRILDGARNTPNADLINVIMLRSQSQAEYSPDNIGHFGLALHRYAHFTSPIRRYADLIVHRALIRALKLGSDGLPDATIPELPEIAAKISAAERRSMAAERETVDRLIAHHLADRIGATFEGRITGVTRAGLFVRLNETGADGFIPASTIGADYYRYDEAAHALVGDRTGETHRLGDAATVRLVEAAPLAGALRFELLSEGATTTPRGRRGFSARNAGKTGPRNRDGARGGDGGFAGRPGRSPTRKGR